MKKLNLNRPILDVSGKHVSVAALQRGFSPMTQTTQTQESTGATFATLAFSLIDNQRGRVVSDEKVKLNYSILKKIYKGVTDNVDIELDDNEFQILETIFSNLTTSIRAPFLEMVSELNPN